MIFPKFSRPSWTKMNEISVSTVENIDGVEQINLLTSCTTKLHRFYPIFFGFSQKHFPQNSTHLLLSNPSFITLSRVMSFNDIRRFH